MAQISHTASSLPHLCLCLETALTHVNPWLDENLRPTEKPERAIIPQMVLLKVLRSVQSARPDELPSCSERLWQVLTIYVRKEVHRMGGSGESFTQNPCQTKSEENSGWQTLKKINEFLFSKPKAVLQRPLFPSSKNVTSALSVLASSSPSCMIQALQDREAARYLLALMAIEGYVVSPMRLFILAGTEMSLRHELVHRGYRCYEIRSPFISITVPPPSPENVPWEIRSLRCQFERMDRGVLKSVRASREVPTDRKNPYCCISPHYRNFVVRALKAQKKFPTFSSLIEELLMNCKRLEYKSRFLGLAHAPMSIAGRAKEFIESQQVDPLLVHAALPVLSSVFDDYEDYRSSTARLDQNPAFAHINTQLTAYPEGFEFPGRNPPPIEEFLRLLGFTQPLQRCTEEWDVFVAKYVKKFEICWERYKEVRERCKGVYKEAYERLLTMAERKTQKLIKFPNIHPNLQFPILQPPSTFCSVDPFAIEPFYIDQIKDAYGRQQSQKITKDDKSDFLPASLVAAAEKVSVSKKTRPSSPTKKEEEGSKVVPLTLESSGVLEETSQVGTIPPVEIVFDDFSSIPWRNLQIGQKTAPDRYCDRVRRWGTRDPLVSDQEYQGRWFSPKTKLEIRFRHDFAHALDQVLIDYGTPHIRHDGPDHIERVTYTLPGEVVFDDGVYFKGVFELSRGRNEKIFHRYFSDKAPSTIEREFAANGYFVGAFQDIPALAIEPGKGESLLDDGSYISDFDEWSIQINNSHAFSALLTVYPLPKL